MHRLFGKPKAAAPTPTLSDASTSINNRVGALDEKIGNLDGELIKFKDQLKRAKGPAAEGIKRRALETLKRKKMYEQQRDQMAGQAFNVEQTAFAIETVKDTQTTVFAMKAAAQALKVENQKIDIGSVEDLQDDLADMFEDMAEINDLMARSYATPDGLDEDDLEAELAALGDELEGLDDLAAEPAAATATATATTTATATSAAAHPAAAAMPTSLEGSDLPVLPAMNHPTVPQTHATAPVANTGFSYL